MMVPALILGRKGSSAFPGKNVYPILGRKMGSYPMIHALNSNLVDRVFLSTDCEELMALAESLGVEVIKRPDYLCTKEALGEDAFVHGYEEIKKRYSNENIEMVVLLFCNAPTFLASMIDDGIQKLRQDSDLKSAVTVSQMNWYSPVRARRIKSDGRVYPYIPFENYPADMDITVNCDRNSQIPCYFADCCVSVVRPENLENIHQGQPPQKWMGETIAPIHNVGGLDIDEEWQLPLIDGWLRTNGFTDSKTPYDGKN